MTSKKRTRNALFGPPNIVVWVHILANNVAPDLIRKSDDGLVWVGNTTQRAHAVCVDPPWTRVSAAPVLGRATHAYVPISWRVDE